MTGDRRTAARCALHLKRDCLPRACHRGAPEDLAVQLGKLAQPREIADPDPSAYVFQYALPRPLAQVLVDRLSRGADDLAEPLLRQPYRELSRAAAGGAVLTDALRVREPGDESRQPDRNVEYGHP